MENWELDFWFGICGNGDVMGSATKDFPVLARFVNQLIKGSSPELRWTTVRLSRNPQDALGFYGYEDPDEWVWVVSLGEFQGGGLWVEGEEGEGPAFRQVTGDEARAGQIVDIRGLPARFNGRLRHALEPWIGGDLWVVKAFTWKLRGDTTRDLWGELKELGFQPEDISTVPREAEGLGMGKSISEAGLRYEGLGWEVDFPHEIMPRGELEKVQGLHEEASYRLSSLMSSMSQAELDLDGLVRTSEEFFVVNKRRCWLEKVLSSCEPEGVVACVKSFVPEVPLREPESIPADQFLQTRTVSREEARGEIELWKPPGEEELRALEVTTKAVERVTSTQVEEWVRSGRRVIQVPGKAVLTRKAGVGKRRLRAVCCGNHIPSDQVADKKSDLYAGGIDALTVRVVLAYTAQQDGWECCVVDVKTAFLYAPVRGSQEGDKEAPIIVVKPPYLLVQMGLLKPMDRWKVKRALYGLQTSPRDWSEHRDKELRSIRLEGLGGAKLHQALTDESLCFVKTKGGVTLGIMIVYVDDIALFGPKGVVDSVVAAIKQKWRLSDPSWASSPEGVTFCGMELVRASYGWRVTQRRYLQELLLRYEVEGTAQAPLPKWEEPEEEVPDAASIKKAQGITGALLWAVTRSRPDMVFVVSQMAQLSTRTPRRVFEMGLQALRYASTTLGLGLEFRKVEGPSFGEEGQLSHSRSSAALEVYADASHSPNGERSRQCVIVAWKGSILLWEATRQPFTTLSTAESELIALIHASQVGECVSPIVEELIGDDTVISLLGDNSASLASYEKGSGSWRNRHLRMRAGAGREKVAAGVLFPSHVPGHLQVADIGTKPLPAHKLLGLLAIVNVRVPLNATVPPTGAKFFARLGRMSQEDQQVRFLQQRLCFWLCWPSCRWRSLVGCCLVVYLEWQLEEPHQCPGNPPTTFSFNGRFGGPS